MREIKFRGKRVDNKEWVYGNLITNPICISILPTGWEISATLDSVEVIPESVGEFTDLKDKNGKEIYEGDVLQLIEKTEYFYQLHNYDYIFEVKFLEGAFRLVGDKDKQLNAGEINDIGWFELSKYVILGNIFTNPELLK